MVKYWNGKFVHYTLVHNLVTFLQVYPDGIRHIRADKRVNEWKTPGKKTIVKCAVNQRQVVIALTGGELVYFEMDPVSCLLGVLFSFRV
jgi:hypothetical protein